MSQDFELEKLNKEYQTLIESFPKRVPLDTKIIYKRKIDGYEEWKIEYTAEGPDTMPEPSGRRIPAYLLVPTGEPPFPAMICFHQCNCDCDIGKEAVVGKRIDRPDQAYGYELVRQGFVVIAPDTINCGERNIPSIRQEGLRISGSQCGSKEKYIGQRWSRKVIFDGMRAVDFLQSLDFVDLNSIGAIGHSMGAHQTFLTMAFDQRIKVGIVSGFDGTVHGLFKDYEEGLAALSPRLFMQFHGSYDGSPEEIQKLRDIHNSARRFYEEANASENLILRILPCGHHFHDEFKWEAYYKLKQYFGMAGVKESVSLKDVIMNAQAVAWWYWSEDDKERFLKLPLECYVLANEETLTRAFIALFYFLRGKCPGNSSVNVHVEKDQDNCYVVCTIPGGSDEAKSAYEYTIRSAEQLFFENSASLRRESAPDQVKYVVMLQKAN